MKYKLLDSIDEIAGLFSCYLLDIFGVLHDGVSAYPYTVSALKKLQEANKQVILFSNSPRRAGVVAGELEKFGITPDLYSNIITSGEMAYNYFATQPAYGKNCYHIGTANTELLFQQLGYNIVNDPEKADFVAITAPDGNNGTLDSYVPVLKQILERQLHCFCINPDKIVVRQDGAILLCAGSIAQIYERLGGDVTYFGKPYPGIYNHVLSALTKHKKEEIIAVGDGLATDILGAANNDFNSLLICGGLLSKELNLDTLASESTSRQLQNLFEANKAAPTYVLPFLK